MSLSVRELTKSYGDKIVVDHLSFEMEKPGVYALLGTNGAGKTTSIRMILNMLSKDSGEVLWNGKPLDISTCNVGYLAEERGLYPKYELMDQLIYFAAIRGVKKDEAKKRIKYWSDKLDLGEYLYPQPIDGRRPKPKKADQLSKGNQQKVQLITALISNPDLIVIDEPFSGLDPINTDLFKAVIREQIENDKYIIMSSHQMAAVEEFCTDITILNKSKTVLQGHLSDIKKSYGRVNLTIKCESDIVRQIEESGARLLTKKEYEYHLKVDGEEQANRLLRKLIDDGVSIVTFDLREPSLHEIFVEKVGEADEGR